jgi:8-oxo-dGTP pyrophosphatase MutT (NUDIX family)
MSDAIGRIRALLQARQRNTSDPPSQVPRAAVALLVRAGSHDLEILLIRRARRVGDPWSGHIAFPGGRSEPGDLDPVETAIRETREEVGIVLHRELQLLGALDDVEPATTRLPPLLIHPFAFQVDTEAVADTGPEVEHASWIPLGALRHPAAFTEYHHRLDEETVGRFPALAYEDYVIWGLTHRILGQFLAVASGAEERR